MRHHCGTDLFGCEVLFRRAAQMLLEPLHQCGIDALEIGGNGALEPARPFGQRILSPMIGPLPNLTKRYKPVFARLEVVEVSLRLASYQRVPAPS